MSQLSRGEILDRLAGGESFRGTNLVRADLSALDLTRIDLAEANLRMADLSRADLREARLTGCFLSGATLNEANLAGSNLVEASLIGVSLKDADLSRADLSGADLTGASLEDAQLAGAYLVGTYLNETDLRRANLSTAYIRMAQMSGSDLSGASFDGADLSHANLSGVRLERACMVDASLAGANLSASVLTGCNLRGADLTGANLSGCNLTGAKLRGIRFDGVKLDDAWADWVDLGSSDGEESRVPIEEVFAGIIGKPIAQVLVEGHVSDDAWAAILDHLCDFKVSHPNHSDVKLKAIHQGVNSSALYIEAEDELSLAAYFAQFSEIVGKGSAELFEKLAAVIPNQGRHSNDSKDYSSDQPASSGSAESEYLDPLFSSDYPLGRTMSSPADILQCTNFWASEKAFAILTNRRQLWFEAASSESLTLRPPHGSAVGLDLICGRFVTEDSRRSNQTDKTAVGDH